MVYFQFWLVMLFFPVLFLLQNHFKGPPACVGKQWHSSVDLSGTVMIDTS